MAKRAIKAGSAPTAAIPPAGAAIPQGVPDLTSQEVVRIAASNERVTNLINQLGNGSLIPRPDFQRRLVWTDKHKRAFIETVLRQYPFPEIYIATIEVDQATARSTRILVDGQQRITTLQAYFLGDDSLRLGQDVPAFADLTSDQRRAFLQYTVTVRDLGELGIETVREIYRRINSTNYALNNMENLYAQYDGPFRQFCEWVADHAFFADHGIFTESDKRRMFDLSFAITFVISVVQGYPTDVDSDDSSPSQQYPHRNEQHEVFLKKYNTDFPQENTLRTEFDALFEKIELFELPKNSRAWKQIDLLTLLVESHHAVYKDRTEIKPKEVGKRLESFYKEVDKFDTEKVAEPPATERGAKAMNYLKAATRASTDRFSRVQRGRIIEKFLKGAAKS